METFLGAGAHIIEEVIVKNVYKDLGLNYEESKDFDFTGCLKDVLAKRGAKS